MFDFETLRIIWWGILVFLVCGFAVLDGFDLGIGILLPFLGKTDDERRVMLNTVGPTWEGSQTWLITLGAISFGAWSIVYAAFFSGLYTGLLVLLFALFLRPVGFDYRSKLPNPHWRNSWDWALFIGGLVPATVLSLAAGNLIIGLPFELNNELRSTYSGSFWDLFRPFPLLCALTGVALFTLHGAVFLHWRTEGGLAERALKVIRWSSPAFTAGFILAGVWVGLNVDGYQIVSAIDTSIAANPLAKTVSKAPGLWLNNYRLYPWLAIAPACVLAGSWLVVKFSAAHRHGMAFLVSSVMTMGAVVTAGGSMFPFIMPSSTHPASSLTVWDASSSHYTLQLLFAATVVLMPVVLAYTIWVYRVLRGKVTIEQIRGNEHTLY
jgi:cytochrome d ubiquinol oxidase subunit II